MKTNQLSLFFLLLFGALGAVGQEQVEMTLAEAQAYAVEHSFAVRYARMDAASAEREVKLITSAGLPHVNGSIEYNNYIDIPTQVAPADAFGFPAYLTQFLGAVSEETGVPINAPEQDPNAISEFQFGAPQTMTAGIAASQLIFDGSYFVGLQAAKAYASAQKSAIEKSEDEVKRATAEAYHTVLVSEENLRILENSRGVVSSNLTETEALFENGFVEEQDLDQLKLTLADLDSRINYARKQSEISKDLLKFQIGMPLENQIILKDDIASLTAAPGAAGLLSFGFSLDGNAEYETQNRYVELSKLNVKNEKAKSLPRISAFYNYQRNAQRDEFNFLDFDEKWYPIQLWGVQLTVPIFNSLEGSHRIQQAKIDVERASTALDQIAQGAKLEYLAAKNEYEMAVENTRIQKESKALAERIFNTTQIKYKEGVASSFELSQAQNQQLTAQGNYIGAVLQLLNTKARLTKALNQY